MDNKIKERKEQLSELWVKLKDEFKELNKDSYFINITFNSEFELNSHNDFYYLIPNSSGEWQKLTLERKVNYLDNIEASLNRAKKQLSHLKEFLG